MLMRSNSLPLRRDSNGSDVHIPAIDVVALRQGMHDARVDGIAVDDLDLGKAYPLLKAGRSLATGHHHQLNELLTFYSQLAPLGLFESVFGG